MYLLWCGSICPSPNAPSWLSVYCDLICFLSFDFFFPSYFPICVSLSRHISLHISLHLQKLTRRDLCVLSHTNQSSAPPPSSWLLLPSLLLIAMSGRGRKVRWQRGRRAEHQLSPPSPNSPYIAARRSQHAEHRRHETLNGGCHV